MSDIVGEETDLGDFKGLEPIKDQVMSHGLMIATVALNMAIKYHDIGTVQDGTLYQQYKLEGKNMIPLDLHMVLETAKQMEEHLITAPDRLANVVINALEAADEDGQLEILVEEDSTSE